MPGTVVMLILAVPLCNYLVNQFLPFPFRFLAPAVSSSSLTGTPSSSEPSSPCTSTKSLSCPSSVLSADSPLPPKTSLTIRLPSFSSPLLAPHPMHFQSPTSARLFVPGGAWPLTSRHCLQIKTMRFLAAVSSSPRSVSMILSYQWFCSPAGFVSYCAPGKCADEGLGASNALGANSADGSVRWGGDAKWCCSCAPVPCG